jgi:hypothetical protein
VLCFCIPQNRNKGDTKLFTKATGGLVAELVNKISLYAMLLSYLFVSFSKIAFEKFLQKVNQQCSLKLFIS